MFDDTSLIAQTEDPKNLFSLLSMKSAAAKHEKTGLRNPYPLLNDCFNIVVIINTRPVHIIGAPTDVGASILGARMGPEALRVAELQQAISAYGCKVSDLGDLHGPPNPNTQAIGGYRHLDEVAAWNNLVFDAVTKTLNEQSIPLLLGGDHCLAIGSIAAVAAHCRRHQLKLRVIWLDAHADFNTHTITPSGNIHGMPVACLCGHGPKALTTLGGVEPNINTDEIRQIGIRSVDAKEKHFLREAKLTTYDMRFIDEVGMRHTLELALDGIDAQTHVHLSFDLDFLDPQIAPGVGTRVLGGPSYREAQLCMEMIADTGRLCSLDVVELNPACDMENKTALLTVDLIESLFGKSTLERLYHSA